MIWKAPHLTAVDEPFVGDERGMLEGLLDVNRATLPVRCAGLSSVAGRLATAKSPGR